VLAIVEKIIVTKTDPTAASAAASPAGKIVNYPLTPNVNGDTDYE
jgi:hypothetical protein